MRAIAKFSTMSAEELEEQLDLLKTDLFNLRIQNTTKELQDTNRIRQTRRDIARVMTLINTRRRDSAGQA